MTSGTVSSRLEQVRAALGAEYEVIRPLGEGGMATVYLANERALRRPVAIKVLDPDLAASPVFRSRFQLEAETAAQLQHPNIVSIYRVGTAGGLAYFCMAYVDGDTLSDRLRGAGPLPVDTALKIARQVAEALAAAHRRGIIHRDVKPGNVLIDTETGRAMVTDFGIASVAVAAAKPDMDDSRLTAAGMVMGTPRYMSPEQASGVRDLTPASDLYALGVVLYEMLTGAFPFKVGEPPNYMLAHLTQPMIPLVSRIGDMPREVESLVHRLLEKEPEKRYATADEAIAAIDEARQAEGPTTGSRRLAEWRTRRRQYGLMALAATALALTVGAAMLRRTRTESAAVDPRRSLLIGFFENNTPDRDLDWLRLGGVEYLTQSLSRWTDLRVVDAERLLTLARRAGLPDNQPLSQDDAVRLARNAGVWTTTVGSILKYGDSLKITVRVYDVGSGKLVTTASAVTPGDSLLPAAFQRIADQILNVAGAPTATLGTRDPPTRSIAAYRAYVDGVRLSSSWDISGAIDAFSRAVAADSTFALAYYELSQAEAIRLSPLGGSRYVAHADTAVLRSGNLMEKDRTVIRAWQALMHSDLPTAGALYAQVAAKDSTSVDAAMGLADVAFYDRTLRPNGRGGEVLPLNLTKALRGYQRALELDPTDHQLYQNVLEVLSLAALDEANTVAAFRDPPNGPLGTVFLRAPVRVYSVLLLGDSLALIPSESLTVRYRPHTIDSLRARARARGRDVIRRWLEVAPAEGQPYLVQAMYDRLDRNYDGALLNLQRAQSLGAETPLPYPMHRLSILLDARRFGTAMALADSLDKLPAADPALGAGLYNGPQLAALFARGRVKDGLAHATRFVAAVQQLSGSTGFNRRIDLISIIQPLRAAAEAGQATIASVRSATAAVEKVVAAAPDSEQTGMRRSAARTFVFAAAAVGDTSLARTWQRVPGIEYSPDLAAWAAVNAGDPKAAARLLAALPADSSREPFTVYARAQTLMALGRREQALHTYELMDSLDVGAGSGMVDWVLVARSYGQRAALYDAMGDSASAIRDYRLFTDLWKNPDPALRPERDRAIQAQAELERADRPDRPR